MNMSKRPKKPAAARRQLPVVSSRRSDLAHYNPKKGLKEISVAQAGERYFKQAKDAEGLFKAITTKIAAIVKYVGWRNTAVHWGGKQDRSPAILPDADPGDKVAHRWRKRFFIKGDGGTWSVDDAKMAAELEEAQQRCLRLCEGTDTYAKAIFTGEFEQYTPSEYIEVAREVLGEIELDRASCEIAQRTVRAARFFAVADDGLKQEWHGRVFLNPPYHRDLLPAFVAKLIAEIKAGRVTEAIMLTNNGTDTCWFGDVFALCDAICFTHGRINFIRPGGAEAFPTQFEAALAVLKAWDFKLINPAFIWGKVYQGGELRMCGGYTATRMCSEQCWLATRGHPKQLSRNVRQVIIEPMRKSDCKPDRVRGDIERLFDGPYLELFARARTVGWDSWGREVDKFPLVKYPDGYPALPSTLK
jgi:hypothetical protein